MAFESLVTQRAEPHPCKRSHRNTHGGNRQMLGSSGGRGSNPNSWVTPSAICIGWLSAKREFLNYFIVIIHGIAMPLFTTFF